MTNTNIFQGIPSSFSQLTKTYNSYPDYDISGVSYKGFYKYYSGNSFEIKGQIPYIHKVTFSNGVYVSHKKFTEGRFNIVGYRYDYKELTTYADFEVVVIAGINMFDIFFTSTSIKTLNNLGQISAVYPTVIQTEEVFADWSGGTISHGSYNIFFYGWIDLN
jgi:hypothetical protein